MKKLLIAFAMLITSMGVFAQDSTKTKKAHVKTSTAATTTAAGPTKKDGTADMRYKANKTAKTVPAGPAKKDGTPDMRYKANKKDSSKKHS